MRPTGMAGSRTILVAAVLVLLFAAACGNQSPETVVLEPATGPNAPTATTTAGPEMTGSGMSAPPPFVLRYADRELALRPHAFCYDNGCADGIPDDPPDIGSPREVEVFVPVEGWDLSATFQAGGVCGRHQTVTPSPQGDGWYLLRPAGRAGSYAIELFASGGGDMIAQFLWTTPEDGPLAEPRATMSVIADHDGLPDSYGIELSMSNLADTPEEVVATVTVTADNGRSTTFEAEPADNSCRPPGTLSFDGPDAAGREAAELGGFPFRYDVELVLDGTSHRATAHYPRDEIADEEPAVLLDFDPPLPALH